MENTSVGDFRTDMTTSDEQGNWPSPEEMGREAGPELLIISIPTGEKFSATVRLYAGK